MYVMCTTNSNAAADHTVSQRSNFFIIHLIIEAGPSSLKVSDQLTKSLHYMLMILFPVFTEINEISFNK